ncbi:YqzE-like protein [Melghirimyces profundicolus]|uniref:YqzE-like protein n=1 Tax=Melghirimyces profundicolus TaxID=1242148 RepID=A0A2T6C9Q0_9BACL|nr:YqzE family protein [Melghirimyces profundicolus]PTX65030.1 YqzE-like protein [Melghirimyces profundicolus]
MSTQDYLKFLVQEMVKYMDTPKDQRKEQRIMRRDQRLPWIYRWFGIIPFGMKMYVEKKKPRTIRGDST